MGKWPKKVVIRGKVINRKEYQSMFIDEENLCIKFVSDDLEKAGIRITFETIEEMSMVCATHYIAKLKGHNIVYLDNAIHRVRW